MDNGRLSVMQTGPFRVGDPAFPEVGAWLWVAEHKDRVRVTRADGRFRFDGVPVGMRYRVRVWHESRREAAGEVELGTERPQRLDLSLPMQAASDAPPAR